MPVYLRIDTVHKQITMAAGLDPFNTVNEVK